VIGHSPGDWSYRDGAGQVVPGRCDLGHSKRMI